MDPRRVNIYTLELDPAPWEPGPLPPESEAAAWGRYFSLNYSLPGFVRFWREGGPGPGGADLEGSFEVLARRWVAEWGGGAPPPSPAELTWIDLSPALARWGWAKAWGGAPGRAERLALLALAAGLDSARPLRAGLAALAPPATPAELEALLGAAGPSAAEALWGAVPAPARIASLAERIVGARGFLVPVRAARGLVTRLLEDPAFRPEELEAGAAALELRLEALAQTSPFGAVGGRNLGAAVAGAVRRAAAWGPARAAWLGAVARAPRPPREGIEAAPSPPNGLRLRLRPPGAPRKRPRQGGAPGG